MKLCLGVGVALLLLGCGGGEELIDFQDPREPESSGRDEEARRDSRDAPSSGSQGPGGGGGPQGQDLLANCSGLFSCQGSSVTLSQSETGCELQTGGSALTLMPDGTIVFMGEQLGTWEGDTAGFAVCFEGTCTTCSPL